MTVAALVFPYPAKALWPNSRPHWSQKARAVKQARRDAWAATLEANLPKPTSPVSVTLRVHPRTARRPDADNVVAAFKSLGDGIADALGVNDSTFNAPTVVFGEPMKEGGLTVVLTYE